MSSVLYVPPTDRPDALAPSAGGGLPPSRILAESELTGKRMWVECVGQFLEPIGDRALLLSLDGAADPLGMSRALDLLVLALASTEPTGTIRPSGTTYWVDYEEVGDCEFGSSPSHPVALCVAAGGVFWRLDLPDDLPDQSDVRIVGEMLARLVGGAVVVAACPPG